jgi:hypothetical protein
VRYEVGKAIDFADMKLECLPSLYINEHSWAGEESATIVAIIDRHGCIQKPPEVEYGGWYSQNGNITRDDPHTYAKSMNFIL